MSRVPYIWCIWGALDATGPTPGNRVLQAYGQRRASRLCYMGTALLSQHRSHLNPSTGCAPCPQPATRPSWLPLPGVYNKLCGHAASAPRNTVTALPQQGPGDGFHIRDHYPATGCSLDPFAPACSHTPACHLHQHLAAQGPAASTAPGNTRHHTHTHTPRTHSKAACTTAGGSCASDSASPPRPCTARPWQGTAANRWSSIGLQWW